MKQPYSSSTFQPNQILINIEIKSNQILRKVTHTELKLNDLHQVSTQL